MKNNFLLFFLILCCHNLFSQSSVSGFPPQAFYHQVFVSNANVPISNSTVTIKITIYYTQITPSITVNEYVETHTATTDYFGIATIIVGTGTVNSGVFRNIKWRITPKYLKTEITASGTFDNIPDIQMLSVPYTLAKDPLSDWVSIWDFANGRKIDDNTGTSNATQALIDALNSPAKVIYIPDPQTAYRITSTITIPPNKKIVGANKFTTKLTFAKATGKMFNLRDGAQIDNLYLDGLAQDNIVGSSNALYFSGYDGHQQVSNCKIINFYGPCVYFESSAGSQCVFNNIEIYKSENASVDNVDCAIVIDPLVYLVNGEPAAVTRKFINLETLGKPSFDFGGCADVLINNSFLGKLVYSENSRGVLISNCRIANANSIVVNGHNNTITGCNIKPRITIASGSDKIAITGNSYNHYNIDNLGYNSPNGIDDPVLDMSGNNRNAIGLERTVLYTPLYSSSDGSPVNFGTGSRIRGEYTRSNDVVTLTLEVDMGTGSGKSLGTGDLQFSIPDQIIPKKSPAVILSHIQAQYGTGVIFSSLGNTILATTITTPLPGLSCYVTALTTGTGFFLKNNVPYPVANVTAIRLSITYSL